MCLPIPPASRSPPPQGCLRAFDLWLACHTQEDIAERVGVPQRTIADWVAAFSGNLDAKDSLKFSFTDFDPPPGWSAMSRYGPNPCPGCPPGASHYAPLCAASRPCSVMFRYVPNSPPLTALDEPWRDGSPPPMGRHSPGLPRLSWRILARDTTCALWRVITRNGRARVMCRFF